MNNAIGNLSELRTHTITSEFQARSPFPALYRTTLKYQDVLAFTSTAGSSANQQYCANGLFDPDITSTGHQPRFFDALCSSSGPYTTYRVTGFRAKVTFDASSATVPFLVACGVSAGATIPSGTPFAVGELPGWKSWIAPGAGTSPPEPYYVTVDVAECGGISRAQMMADDGNAALYSANPVNTCFFNARAVALASGTGTIYGLFELEYDVQFEQPYLQVAS